MITVDEYVLNDYIHSKYTKENYIKSAEEFNSTSEEGSVLLTQHKIISFFSHFMSGPASLRFYKDDDGVLCRDSISAKSVKLTGDIEQDIMYLNINSSTDVFYQLIKKSNTDLVLRYFKGDKKIYNHTHEIYN